MKLAPWVSRAALRVRPHLTERAWSALLELASLAADVPTLGLPDLRRVLVLAPHPDDETIGCGGTIARLTDQGAHVEVVVATDGEATVGAPFPRGEIARRRRAEVVAACGRLGVTAPPWCLGLPDGELRRHGEVLASRLQEAVDRVRPEVVLTPWLLDRHPDHRAVTAALARTTAAKATEVWGYEAHTPLTPTRAVAIDGVVDRKLAALRLHVTAGEAFGLEATVALNRWRSLLTAAGHGHAEAFHAAPWERFTALAATVATAG